MARGDRGLGGKLDQLTATTITIRYRDYGYDEEDAAELRRTIGSIAPLRLSPWHPPAAGDPRILEIFIEEVGVALAAELLIKGGFKIYEKLVLEYEKYLHFRRGRGSVREPGMNFVPGPPHCVLSVGYDDVLLNFGRLSEAGISNLPQFLTIIGTHLTSPPLKSWKVRQIIFNAIPVTGGWQLHNDVASYVEDGLGRYWALAALMDHGGISHIYDSTERTLEEFVAAHG